MAAVARRQRQVQNVAATRFLCAAGSRKQGHLVTGYVQHIRTLLKDRLGAIAVMNIEIQYCNPLDTLRRKGMPGSYRHMIEQAESHCATTFRVVARRPDNAKGILGFTRENLIDGKTGRAATA